MVVLMAVITRMIVVILGSSKDERANDVDDQTNDRNRNGFRELNGLRDNNALDGGEGHHCGNAKQEHRAGVACENF
jgi:hypothetical protein